MSCDVELVEDRSAVEREHIDAPEHVPVAVQLIDICGYLDLDEARQVRDQLHQHKIVSELVIRTSPETPTTGEVVEEYWLRAEAGKIREVKAMIEGSAPAPPAASAADPVAEGFQCGHCGRPVNKEESFCANCGRRFSK
ncbi:MAG: hypothetical protein V3S47_07790 [Acidobacteriota bacterium]